MKLFEPIIRYEKNKINRNYKKLTEFDIDLLSKLLNRFENNEIETVLRNDKWYSKDTIEKYKKLKESVNRLQSMIDMSSDAGVEILPKSW